MKHTLFSSVSAVNTLCHWYLLIFYIFQLVLDFSSLYVGRRQTAADRNSDASEGVCGTDGYDMSLSPSLKQTPTPTTTRYITAPVDTRSEKRSVPHCR
jgi:hypothetical protein